MPHAHEAMAVYGDKEIQDLLSHFAAVLTQKEITEIPDELLDLKTWMAAHRGGNLLNLYSDLMI